MFFFLLILLISFQIPSHQLLLDLLAFREQALRLILDLSSTVITLLVRDLLVLIEMTCRCCLRN
jgi:hypothetical protein